MKSSLKLFSLYYILLAIILLKESLQVGNGKDKGAYLSVPNSDNLQYRLGNGLGYIGNGWDDARMSNLSSLAGYDGQRKKLPENHFNSWGYGIEVGDCQSNVKLGILDIVGYLATPLKSHSSNTSSDPELCYPDNLYKDIFITDGDGNEIVNPENYWANYVYQTVSHYKDYVKIWETWNEPDYVTNYNVINDWKNNPPEPSHLTHWNGKIFYYIRLLRITYEVAKKVDPNCFVATGGIGYSEFLDLILRYTDNPEDGSVTNDYPAYGGAYFDCDAYHQYPQYGTTDLVTGKGYHDNGSDMLALKVVILKKSHEYTLNHHGFGESYPKKIFVNTETGVNSEKVNGVIGGDLVRRNWILKLAFYQIEYDIKQIHMFILADNGKGMADYSNLGKYQSIEEGFKHLKSSSRGRLVLKKIQLGKYEFDNDNTQTFRNSLPEGATGIVLKRKFKYKEVDYYSDYLYSAWIYCEKEEVSGEIEYQLNLNFDPLMLDWEGNQKNILKNDKIKLTSTPIILIENNYNYPDSTIKRKSSSNNVYLRALILVMNLLLLF